MKKGNRVKNGLGYEFEIVEVKDDKKYTYPIIAQKVDTGEKVPFTIDGVNCIGNKSDMDLILDNVEPLNLLIGKIVMNGKGVKFLVKEVDTSEPYPIVTEDFIGSRVTYTIEGNHNRDRKSLNLDLQVGKDGNILTFEEDVTETVESIEAVVEDVVEPVEDVVELVEDVTIGDYVEPVEEASRQEFYAFSTSITPYEASLKATKLELSTEITGLITDNGDISEIILKVKKLKKLLEL